MPIMMHPPLTLHLELWPTKLYVSRDTRLRSNIQKNFDEWYSMTMMVIGHLYFTRIILMLQRNRLPCFTNTDGE